MALPEYKVFDSSSDIPPEMFDDPTLVVERFLPERVADGFALRHWLFCGAYDYCGRFIASERIVKGECTIRTEPSPIPDDLRRRRAELGFDYGKFDFAIHDGKSYLLDANKTPGTVPASGDGLSIARLADGFERMMQTSNLPG